MNTPTAAALRAANAIARSYGELSEERIAYTADQIDRETGLPELIKAASRALTDWEDGLEFQLVVADLRAALAKTKGKP